MSLAERLKSLTEVLVTSETLSNMLHTKGRIIPPWNESQPLQLCAPPCSGQRWWSYKGQTLWMVQYYLIMWQQRQQCAHDWLSLHDCSKAVFKCKTTERQGVCVQNKHFAFYLKYAASTPCVTKKYLLQCLDGSLQSHYLLLPHATILNLERHKEHTFMYLASHNMQQPSTHNTAIIMHLESWRN